MDDEGYLAMDALTGLTVAVLALVIALNAYAFALGQARRAHAERQSAALVLWVLETQWPRLHRVGEFEGRQGEDLHWRLSSTLAVQASGAALCDVAIEVRRGATFVRRADTRRFCVTP